MLMAKGHRL